MSNNSLLQVNNYSHDAYSPYMVNGQTKFLYRNSAELYDHSANVKGFHDSIRVPAQNGLAAVFNGTQTQVDWFPPIQGRLDIWEYFVVELSLVNNDGVNPADVLPAQFIVNYIEEMVSGTNFVTHYNHHLMYELLYLCLDDECIINYQTLGGFTGGVNGVAYTDNFQIPAGGTAKLYIRFYPLFAREKLYVNNIGSQVMYRFHFDSTGMISTSAASSISLTNADMFISGPRFSEDVQRKLTSRARSFPLVSSYFEPQRAILSGQALSDVTKSNVKITEFSGMNVSHLVVMVVPQSATKENLYAPIQLEKISLLVNGSTVSGFQDSNANWNLLQMFNFYYGVTSPSSNFIYVISHSMDPQISTRTGKPCGTYLYSPNAVLELQVATGLAGTYDIYCLCYRHDNIILNPDSTVERIVV